MTDRAHVSGGESLGCVNLVSGWGRTQVLSGVTFSIPAGEMLAVLGRNGVGKTTLISTICGRARRYSGEVHLGNRQLSELPRFERARAGLGLVPQEREIFRTLSVTENLAIAGKPSPNGERIWTQERIFDLFPRLAERARNSGNQLSGGEQQMLSIARALMGNPSVLLLDEPMEGLAPVIVEHLTHALMRLRSEMGLTILLVEQHLSIALDFTSRLLVLERGAIVYDTSNGSAKPDIGRVEALLSMEEA